jgi:hypothetical protein
LRFGRRAASRRKAEHAKNAHSIVQRQSDYAADADLLGGFLHASAVDADVAGFDHRPSEGAALEEADEDEEAVDPHFFFSFASSAKAWLGRAR